jgi:hypothetical protein
MAIHLQKVVIAATIRLTDFLHPGHQIIEIFHLYQRHGRQGHLAYLRLHWKEKQFLPSEKMMTKSGVMMKEMKMSNW